MTGKWTESDGIVSIPEQPSDIFELYIQYLYTGTIYSAKEGDQVSDSDYRDWDLEWDRLLVLHLLADYLGDEGLVNATIDALISKARASKRYPVGYADLVYEHSAPGARIRKLIVDFHVHLGLCEELKSKDTGEINAPLEFYRDVVAEMAKPLAKSAEGLEVRTAWISRESCKRYHDHSSVGKGDGCRAVPTV